MSLKTQDLFNVSNKVVVVTGGSRGIGEMITSGFLANGSRVYVTARKEEALVNKAEELSKNMIVVVFLYVGIFPTVKVLIL